MNEVPKYITSIQIQNQLTGFLNISFGFEENGAIMICFQDTAKMEQDSNYINDSSFPNSALIAKGKYSMWVSMFMRHTGQRYDVQRIE